MRECPKANNPKEKVRELQRALYRAAKQSKSRRFHALYDKVYRKDILMRSWKLVKSNQGSSGIDEERIEEIETKGIEIFIAQIQEELKEGSYHPRAVKRVYIPKPDGRRRPLGIPTVKDRVVQTAMKIVLEPIFEADFQPCSFGFRPKKSAHDANEIIRQMVNRGYEWVVDADIENYFDSIDRRELIKMIQKRISDKRMLKLIEKFLESGILEEGIIRKSITGTPQGGPLSPLLANIYLNFLDKVWIRQCDEIGILVRYCDDGVILCQSETKAKEALRRLSIIMENLKLQLNMKKTKVVNLREGNEGFDFLGFHQRKVKSYRYKGYYLHKWPNLKAMKSIRQKIKNLVGDRSHLKWSLQEIIIQLNPILRGWGNYFAKGNSTKKFRAICSYAQERLYLFLSKKCGKSGRGWRNRWQHIDWKKEGLYQLVGTISWHIAK